MSYLYWLMLCAFCIAIGQIEKKKVMVKILMAFSKYVEASRTW